MSVVIGPVINSFNDEMKIFVVVLRTTKREIVVISQLINDGRNNSNDQIVHRLLIKSKIKNVKLLSLATTFVPRY